MLPQLHKHRRQAFGFRSVNVEVAVVCINHHVVAMFPSQTDRSFMHLHTKLNAESNSINIRLGRGMLIL